MEFKIEKGVLKSCFPQKSETEIIVPDGIHTIGAFAFSSLTVFDHVEYISIPEGVTKIGELAFQACHNLKRISLPETLIEIGNSAFANCRSLEKIRVPDSVLSIGDRLFFWCTGLKTIILPTQLKAVPIDTFLHCQSLEHIDLPQYLEEIGPGAFCDCLSLKSITIPKTVKDLHLVYHGFCDDCPSIQSIYVEQGSNSFQSKNGVLFTAGGTELIRCPEGFLEEEYVIPEEIINIRQMAFKNCMSLRRVVLPESLERISFWAFGNCKNLTKIEFSDGLKTIENSIFSGCENLREIELPGSLSNISENAFNNCPATISTKPSKKSSNLITIDGVLYNSDRTELIKYSQSNPNKEFIVPDGVEKIRDHAFQNCLQLEKVIFPLSLKSIGEWAFYGCGMLSEIIIPNGVNKVEESTFNGCENLRRVILSDNLQYIERFSFSGCKRLDTITFPNQLIHLGFHAFEHCGLIGKIILPDSVKAVGEGAFSGCRNLQYVEWHIKESELFPEDTAFYLGFEVPFFLPNCSPRKLHRWDKRNALWGFSAAIKEKNITCDIIYEIYSKWFIHEFEMIAILNEDPEPFIAELLAHTGTVEWLLQLNILEQFDNKIILGDNVSTIASKYSSQNQGSILNLFNLLVGKINEI